ncbi:hypothetical protein [Xylanimonas sp. McL0601]|uniref:hypothetical protein n=1 Tax=Xylanimonas sp. McL0601 TaxID=3414739 RepID=UPI003CEF7319
MAVPDSVCWGLSDEPSKGRFVTHTRLPGVPWRVRLPAPMPASWVVYLFLGSFAVSLVTFISAAAMGHHVAVALLEGCAAAWLLGRCLAPFADVRLRREAFALMDALHEEQPEAEAPGPDGDAAAA